MATPGLRAPRKLEHLPEKRQLDTAGLPLKVHFTDSAYRDLLSTRLRLSYLSWEILLLMRFPPQLYPSVRWTVAAFQAAFPQADTRIIKTAIRELLDQFLIRHHNLKDAHDQAYTITRTGKDTGDLLIRFDRKLKAMFRRIECPRAATTRALRAQAITSAGEYLLGTQLATRHHKNAQEPPTILTDTTRPQEPTPRSSSPSSAASSKTQNPSSSEP